MQFKFKTLAAAALLAAASLPSFAAISTATDPTMILAMYDATGTSSASYFRNLGAVSQVTNAAAGTTVAFNAPAVSTFTGLLGAIAPTDLGWAVFALDTTAGASKMYWAGGTTALAPTSSDIGGLVNFLTGTFGTFPALDATAGVTAAGTEYAGAQAQNVAPGAATNSTDVITGVSFNTFDVASGVGSSANFFRTVQAGGTVATTTQINTAATGSAFLGGAKGGYFTLGNNASLTWTAIATAAPAAVPVPAAALLFGPALLAMAGVGRRNKKSV